MVGGLTAWAALLRLAEYLGGLLAIALVLRFIWPPDMGQPTNPSCCGWPGCDGQACKSPDTAEDALYGRESLPPGI